MDPTDQHRAIIAERLTHPPTDGIKPLIEALILDKIDGLDLSADRIGLPDDDTHVRISIGKLAEPILDLQVGDDVASYDLDEAEDLAIDILTLVVAARGMWST